MVAEERDGYGIQSKYGGLGWKVHNQKPHRGAAVCSSTGLQADGGGVDLDEEGRPVACELLPGNTTDLKLLIPMIKRLQARFEAGSFCVVEDHGMISEKTIEAIEAPGSRVE